MRVARERRPAYVGTPVGGSPTTRPLPTSLPADALDDDRIRRELASNERLIRRLHARNAELARILAERGEARARAADPDDPRAAQRARRHTAAELRNDLNWSPAQVKRTLDTSRDLRTLPAAAAAFAGGEIGPEHARVIGDILRHLAGEGRRRAERELVALALECDPVVLGRHARRLLAELDHDAAMDRLDRQHANRYARISQDPDGVTRLSAGVAGLDGEVLQTAIEAFRTPDPPGRRPRSPEQATADAVVAMARAALDHGVETTEHGSRPHVTVSLSWHDLCGDRGVGETTWSGPLPVGELRRLLDDSSISRLITGPDSVPLDTGRATRTVSPAIWRAIVTRDRTCTVEGCDAPPSRCDAAHLDRRWKDGAGVSVEELGLACRPHHRIVDRQEWVGRIVNGRVVWTRPPRAGPGPP